MSTAAEQKPLSLDDCKSAFVSVSADTMIDFIHPRTGLSLHYSKDLARVREDYPDAEIMTIEAWCEAKGKRQDTPVIWTEVTEEKYWEMLEVLPPAIMAHGGFMVGEPCDHHAANGRPRFQAYLARHGKWLEASRPMTVKEFNALAPEAKVVAS